MIPIITELPPGFFLGLTIGFTLATLGGVFALNYLINKGIIRSGK